MLASTSPRDHPCAWSELGTPAAPKLLYIGQPLLVSSGRDSAMLANRSHHALGSRESLVPRGSALKFYRGSGVTWNDKHD